MNRTVSVMYNNYIRNIFHNYLFLYLELSLFVSLCVFFCRLPLLHDNSYLVYLYFENVTFCLELVAVIREFDHV